MARTALPVTPAPGPYAGAGAVVTLAPADPANGNRWRASGRDLLVARHNGAAAAQITVVSEPDPYGRRGDIVETIQPGETRIYGPFALEGWMQPDGDVYVDVSSADVALGVIRL